jgi:dipeptidyl aminopeptidase/acylaminoacyl peptidase
MDCTDRSFGRENSRLHPVTLPPGRNPASNSELEWAPTGDRLYVALQTEEWRKKAAERFQSETKGPIVVHSTNEPFLAWDAVRRLSQIRSIAAYEVVSGQTREILPEKRISSYSFTRDGALITYLEDITEKTDYDIYEDFFDDRFNATTTVLNAHGYAVMQPSVRFETGFPGEAWIKSVTCAANKLIEMGIADSERLGIHGTSYGG